MIFESFYRERKTPVALGSSNMCEMDRRSSSESHLVENVFPLGSNALYLKT